METETKILKTADKTKYMREYKRKQYQEKGDIIKNKNKAYYYKYRNNISTEEMKKYDIYLPIVVKIKKNLDELQKVKPELINDILISYIDPKAINGIYQK
jgi:hypothetical protein